MYASSPLAPVGLWSSAATSEYIGSAALTPAGVAASTFPPSPPSPPAYLQDSIPNTNVCTQQRQHAMLAPGSIIHGTETHSQREGHTVRRERERGREGEERRGSSNPHAHWISGRASSVCNWRVHCKVGDSGCLRVLVALGLAPLEPHQCYQQDQTYSSTG